MEFLLIDLYQLFTYTVFLSWRIWKMSYWQFSSLLTFWILNLNIERMTIYYSTLLIRNSMAITVLT